MPGSSCSARALWLTAGYRLQRRSLASCEQSPVRDKDNRGHQGGLEESLPGHSECSQGSTVKAGPQRQVKEHQAEGGMGTAQEQEVDVALKDLWVGLSSLALSRVVS